ncbi:MAG: phosphatase PAP2 family protein [Bacteroidales bacterium]|nr:phosphatase PAP2 family protein [Bacteroidales bacterium]
MRKIFALVAFLVAVMPLNAQRRDSVYTASEQFKVTKLIAPVSLMGVGAVCAFTPAIHSGMDMGVKEWALANNGGVYNLPIMDCPETYLQYVPSAAYGIAALSGAGKHSLFEQLVVGVTAYGLMVAGSQAIKFASNVTRPNDNPRSFPSGHTATAFMGAELVRLEYGLWWGLAAYSVAGATAFLRVWNNWHWTSDVIAGAGLGILCAHAAYWLLPFERKLFHMDSKLAGAPHYRWQAVPFAASTPVGASYGLSLAVQW